MRRFAPVLVVAAMGVSACAQTNERADDIPPASSTASVTLPAAAPVPAPHVEIPLLHELPESDAAPAITAAGDEFSVYWAWSIATIAAGTPERLGSGGRTAGSAPTPIAAMTALLAGPNQIEKEIGMDTAIPAGTQVLGVEVSAGAATVDLSAGFNGSSGSLEELIRIAQVVFTLTQFDDVDAVRFRIDGTDVSEIGTHGFDVSTPATRDDFADVRPFILLDNPFPGGTFASGDRIAGESNTFEANVEYVVTDADGAIIAEGFTTATNGNGQWGRFDEVVTITGNPVGHGAVIVFESSPRDGSPTNVVEYPVTFSESDVTLPASS